MRTSLYFIFFIVVLSCIEPYEFVIENNTPTLVVEGYITDRSFIETLSYPSEGRYFKIKLSATTEVDNVKANPVTGALVKLVNESGEEWVYEALSFEPGTYQLTDNDFKALAGVKYKLHIAIAEEVYESQWEILPDAEAPVMGEIDFEEGNRQTYIMEAGEWALTSVRVITANVSVRPNTTGKPIYYRWHFTPLWIYKAPLSPSVISPGHICWATDPNYLNYYALQQDNSGGYKKDLFTIPTIRNERIFEDFSVLITQHVLTENNYFFYKEMRDQNEGGVLVDVPPFNLKSNIHSVNGDKQVSGYFGLVREQATRWYFNKDQLSYNVKNTLKGDCLVVYGPGGPAPECLDCREYSFGTVTDIKPQWWRQ